MSLFFSLRKNNISSALIVELIFFKLPAGFKAKGQAPDSFAKYLLEHQREFELSDSETAYLAGSMFGAGADTVSSILLANRYI